MNLVAARRRFLLAMVPLVGCISSGPEPQLTIGTTDRLVPGVEVAMDATWHAWCSGDSIGGDGGNADVPCDHQPFTWRIACEGACETPARPSGAGLIPPIIPLAAGDLTITVTLVHDESGEEYTRSRTIEVVSPDALVVWCYDSLGGLGFSDECNEHTVPAGYPEIEIFARLDDAYDPDSRTPVHFRSSLLRVNGIVPTYDPSWSGRIMLGALVPDRRDPLLPAGIQPGTYALQLELAGKTTIQTLNAVR